MGASRRGRTGRNISSRQASRRSRGAWASASRTKEARPSPPRSRAPQVGRAPDVARRAALETSRLVRRYVPAPSKALDPAGERGAESGPAGVADLVGREPARAAHLVFQQVRVLLREPEAHLGFMVVDHRCSFRSSVALLLPTRPAGGSSAVARRQQRPGAARRHKTGPGQGPVLRDAMVTYGVPSRPWCRAPRTPSVDRKSTRL